MKKILIGSALILTTAFAATASAEGVLRMLVNGHTQGDRLQAKIENGTTFVAARPFAEALGAKVGWDGEKNTVTVDLPPAGDAGYVNLLEQAIAPTTAQEAVELWAKGVKNRNGALQYAVSSPELKAAMKPDFEASHWVTATSSPWVDSYAILPAQDGVNDKQSFKVTFVWTDSTQAKSQSSQTISTRLIETNWYVESVGKLDAFPYDYITYENDYHAYKLTLPKSWYGRYTVERDGNKAEFIYNNKAGMRAPVITVWSVPTAEFKPENFGRFDQLGEQNGIVYFYIRPFDNPFEGAEQEAYSTMVKEAIDAMATFQLPPKR